MAEPNAVQLRKLAKLGYAMPDGSYYIRAGSVGASDLDNAIKAVGRGEPQSSHNAIRVHIMKRAKALGLSDKIPADWQPDGSLKHDSLDQLADDFLQHFGITGMRWGHHLPGTEALGGPGNPDGANGPSTPSGSSRPSPFIQRGDHTGDSGPSGQSGKPPEQQSQDALDALKALRDRVTQATASAKAQAEGTMPTDLTKEQAAQVHAATASHLAQVAQLHNKAVAATATHKAAQAKISTHSNKAQARRAKAASAKLHAAHMNHLAKTAHQAHAVHKAHVANLKVKTKVSELTKQDKVELAKLSPTQRSALKKLTPQQRATLNHMTPAQRAKLSHLTQAEKTALSHLTPKQKAALAKATAASAKKRHDAAVVRKAAGKAIVSNPSAAAARKQTAAAQAARTPAQKAAVAKLRLNAQNHAQQGMDDPVGTFLEHHGVKGMHWGVRRSRAERAKQYIAQAQAHEEHSKANAEIAINAAKYHDEVTAKGTNSRAFKAAYGADAHRISHEQFQARHGITKEEAIRRAHHDLRVINNTYGRSAILHTQSAERLRAKAARLQHDGLDDEVGEFLEHHGIKGMKWGIRRNGGHPGREGGGEVHPVSADAQKAHHVAETIHRHGTAALSNEDLQHLVNRQRLLQQHAQLNPADPSSVRKGLDFVKTVTSDAKTVLDAVETGRRAVKTFNGLASERPPPRQSRRTRNKPLKVVDIRAA